MRRLLAVSFIGFLAFGWAQPAAFSQDPSAATTGEDGTDETVVGAIRALISAPAAGEAVQRMTLVLGGGSVDLAELHALVKAKFSRHGELVFTPIPLQLNDNSTHDSFVPASDFDARTYRDERVLARALTRRALADLTAQRQLQHVPVRIVGFFDGAVIAVDLLLHDRVRAAELVLISPDLEEMDKLSDLVEKAEDKAVALRRMPRIDVFLTAATPAGVDDLEATLKRRIGVLVDHARIFAVRMPAVNLDTLTEKVAETIYSHRIFATADRRELAFDALVAELANYDVVFVGEQHDSIPTHQFQADLLRALAATNQPVAVALEMFERDVQPVLDRYLAGEIDEAEFLANSRPWPNYRTGYRELIEIAKAKNFPAIAGNVPRRFAAMLARGGVDALNAVPEAERRLFARELRATDGAYKTKFYEVMQAMMNGGSHGEPPKNDGDGGEKPDMLFPMYAAQCLKDDTMAESVADFLAANPGTRVVHVNGGFHSDNRLGTAEKLKALAPNLKIAVISCDPVGNPSLVTAARADAAIADYHVFVPMTHPEPRPSR